MLVDNLDDYLQRELSQARLDSSGKFTLSRERALQKLARFQLPDPSLWLCKLVQASVASGCPDFTADLLPQETLIQARWPGAWTPDSVAQALTDPEPGSDRGLWHLKQAFWSVALHAGRIFSLQLQHWNDVLFFDGEQLHKRPSPNGQAVLRVSQWTREEGPSSGPFKKAEWARRNAEVLRQMRKRCFACPIPVEVDNIRLDALQLCPIHGHGPESTLLGIGFAPKGLPPLRLSAATNGVYGDLSGDNQELKCLYQPGQLAPQAALYGLLTAHFWRQGSSYSSDQHRCAIHWIADGLALDTRTFLELPPRICSFGLIASAEGLELDLTGLKLQDNPAFQRRLSEVVLVAAPQIAQSRPDFARFVEQARRDRAASRFIAGAAGLALLWSIPPVGLTVLGISAYRHFKRPTPAADHLCSMVSQDLRWTQADFDNRLTAQAMRNLT